MVVKDVAQVADRIAWVNGAKADVRAVIVRVVIVPVASVDLAVNPVKGAPVAVGGGDRRFDTPEIDFDKLMADSLYLDNQAHAIVSRIRDMDSATRTQLRRLYSAVRRAVRAPEAERQHEFVMLRARLAYTIARHSLRSLDQIERLLLQVTRKNELRGYERFRDFFEAIVAYNE